MQLRNEESPEIETPPYVVVQAAIRNVKPDKGWVRIPRNEKAGVMDIAPTLPLDRSKLKVGDTIIHVQFEHGHARKDSGTVCEIRSDLIVLSHGSKDFFFQLDGKESNDGLGYIELSGIPRA